MLALAPAGAPFVVAVVLASPTVPVARGSDTWGVLPLELRGIEAHVERTFRELLAEQLRAAGAGKVRIIETQARCTDLTCALGEARGDGEATLVLFGTLGRLGDKVVVQLSALDAVSAAGVAEEQLVANGLSSLDQAAVQLARRFVRGSQERGRGELLTPPEDRFGNDQHNVALRLSALTPLGGTYGDAPGAGVELSFWYEARPWVIEPRLGVRRDALSKSGSFTEVLLELAGYILVDTPYFSPFVGFSGGARYLSERRPRRLEVGQVVVADSDSDLVASAIGFAANTRLGLLLLARQPLKLTASVDYNVIFVHLLDEKSYPQAVSFGVGVIF